MTAPTETPPANIDVQVEPAPDWGLGDDHLIYLAQPHSHKSAEVRHWRFEQGCIAAGSMIRSGYMIFSPIAHSHPIALSVDLHAEFAFWERYDKMMISRCQEVWVLTFSGYLESVGVMAEMEFANALGIPIKYVEPKDWIPDWDWRTEVEILRTGKVPPALMKMPTLEQEVGS